MFKIPENLPKIKNFFWYCYHSLGKIAAILYIVFGSMVIGFLIFPVIRLFSKDKNDFYVKARRYVSNVFKRFLFMLRITDIVEMNVPEMERLRSMKGKVIVANHPSLLDFVCMTALVPNAN